MIFEHESKEISHYGTGKGLKYLSENNEATIKFMEFFEFPNEKYSASDVAAMFNRKYREASGKLCARVPYHKGGFEVTGLPDGVEFKKPTSYGANTIQAIMKNSENIKFFIVENQASDREETLQLTSKHSQALTKIVDSDKIGRILSGETSIKKDDLEVADPDLSASDFQVLMTDLHSHFEKDAMSALIANYQSSFRHKGYILPVYTETEDPYWLFYHPGTATEIESLSPEDSISGYWLDKATSNLEFKLLHKKTSIKALNVICFDGNLGSLRLKKHLLLCNRTTIVLPVDFDTSIVKCLEHQGFS
ncbi:uncharacterized protein LOC114537441 [Dendronephthya gigantea]|uniref:uncharacterized protein LOC114537441 n=1 Tax=Dendronephthya gigantea TaxID=151771 RepID=UPI00106B9213|nr:uncharacterized protein LOC114537441 [Dendronephthya gigantea]XP_028414283.1 uncharacterized protein LOC114537441 [Dendronephthya gigantea]